MIDKKRIVRACIPRSVRDWLRSPAKSLEWAWAETKYAVGLSEAIQIRPEWSLLCHPGAYKFAYWAQDSDPDQVAEFDAFISSCMPGMTLFDIGAHFGLFSFAALHYGSPTSRAIAIDPSTTATRMIKIQAELNSLSDRISIVKASVGADMGWKDMVTVGVHSGGYLVEATESHTIGERTRIQSITLDQLVEVFQVVPTHIKIDVEGSEAEVLLGGSKVLRSEYAPLLFIELHNKIIRERQGDPNKTLSILHDLGYTIFAVNGTPLDSNAILNLPLLRVVARKRSD